MFSKHINTPNSNVLKIADNHIKRAKAVAFEEKCSVFLKTIFPESSITTESIDWNNHRVSSKWKWKIIINAEIKEAIFTAAIKKVFGSDNISFAIIRKAYNVILDIFTMDSTHPALRK
jgi:hypothetical protein